MRKNFVLDTNVLLHDANALLSFEDNCVNIPIYVIEEMDKFKKDLSELGRNARQLSRQLDAFRQEGALTEGVDLPNGGRLRVLFCEQGLPARFAVTAKMDSWIVAAAMELRNREPDVPCIFVSKDTNLRIRADAMGLAAEDYRRERVEISELHTGYVELALTSADITTLREQGELVAPRVTEPALLPNEYVIVREIGGPGGVLARLDPEAKRLCFLPPLKGAVWGVTARNKEQMFALDLLLRDDVQLVTLVGKAGTGKTLLALAAGLQKTADEHVYKRLLVSRPIFPLGRDLGYLPGDVEQKLNPWMQPIHDNLELLVSLSHSGARRETQALTSLMDMGIIQVEPLTYIRGRSIAQQYLIVDEAQNLTPHEVKTILTRAGTGTKVVFTGDPYQIDNPYVDTQNNGLTFLANRFKDQRIAGSITLVRGERSELAELASNLL